MTRNEMLRRLRGDGWRISEPIFGRYMTRVLNEPTRPIGRPGNRVYDERHYRLMVSYLRVLKLCVEGKSDTSYPRDLVELHRNIATALAFHTTGFIWVKDGVVRWSPTPPVAELTGGVATCWPAWD